jgi:mevalonate pyrophosphate decarboxylase
MESTNSYAASIFSKDFNTEVTSFIGCISTETKTVSSSNNHFENVNSITVSNWIIDSEASLHLIIITFSKYDFQIAYITSLFRKYTPTFLMHLSTLSLADKINLWHR